MMPIKLISCIFLLAALLSSCSTPMMISRGTSFGHCRGYCNHEIKISEKEILLAAFKNEDPAQREEKMLVSTGKELKSLQQTLDLNAFMKMEERIGCPDCADGGAEWIEVHTAKGKKRVTFEFNHAPEQLKTLAGQLKGLHDRLATEHMKN